MASSEILQLDDSNFDQHVIQSGDAVLVDFWAPWCGPCLMISPVLDEIASEHAGVLKVAKVNVDNSPALASRYGVNAIPNLLLFKGGQVREQIRGVVPKSEIVSKVAALTAV